MDIVGPLEHNQRRYYILTMIDHFTKYADACVLTETTSDTIWQIFYTKWICTWGCPTYVLTDNGPQFHAESFQRHCQDLGIDKIYATPYHPQADGVVEAFHQFLLRATSAYISQTTWRLVDIVSSVLFAYRSTPHPTTGETPHYLMTGYDQTLPHFQEWQPYTFDGLDTYRRFQLLMEVRRDVLDTTIRKAADRMQKLSPKHKKTYKVGDVVICWLNHYEVTKLLQRFGGQKMMPRWSEPCRIRNFKNKDETVAVVSSLWHKDLTREVAVGDLLALPKNLNQETLNMAKYEMISDLKRAAIPRQQNDQLSAKLEQIPVGDRGDALSKAQYLQRNWESRQDRTNEGSQFLNEPPATAPCTGIEDLTPSALRSKLRRPVHIVGTWHSPLSPMYELSLGRGE